MGMIETSLAWITTYTGKKFHLLDPDPQDVCIEDIAHALSLMCRFNGHVRKFYSVGEHCLHVSALCSRENALAGLLHDGSEAYIADIVKPLKDTDEFAFYREVERRVQGAVYQAFGLPNFVPDEVKEIDFHMAGAEAHALFTEVPEWVWTRRPMPVTICAMPPTETEALFLRRARQLSALPKPL